MGGENEPLPFVPTSNSALEPLRTQGKGTQWSSFLGPLPPCLHSKSPLGSLPGKGGEREKEKKEEEIGGKPRAGKNVFCPGFGEEGKAGGHPLTPPPPPRASNAIFPPIHHSLLGGQSLAKLSTKIKLRCRFLPIALNRADWIRIFLFSSHLDHLGDWDPRGKLGPGGGRRRGSGRLPGTFQPWNLGARVWMPPAPHTLSQRQVHSLPLRSAHQLGWARSAWVLLFSLCFQQTPSHDLFTSVFGSPSCSPTHVPQLQLKGKM